MINQILQEDCWQVLKKLPQNPVRSDSAVMRQGRSAYENLPPAVRQILSGLPVKLVQRNK